MAKVKNSTFDLKIRFTTNYEAENEKEKIVAMVSNEMAPGMENICGYFLGKDAINLYNYITGESLSIDDIE